MISLTVIVITQVFEAFSLDVLWYNCSKKEEVSYILGERK